MTKKSKLLYALVCATSLGLAEAKNPAQQVDKGAFCLNTNQFKVLKHAGRASEGAYCNLVEQTTQWGKHPKGTQWLHKDVPINSKRGSLISEFVGARIMEKLMGPGLIATTYPVCPSKGEGVVVFFNKDLTPAKYAYNRETISEEFFSSVAINPSSQIAYKGFEKALLASFFIFDYDIGGGHNFAVVNENTFTRIDFDKSFGFLQYLNEMENYSIQNFSLLDFYSLFNELKGVLSFEKLLEAAKSILSIPPEDLFQIVDKSMNNLSKGLGDKKLKASIKIPDRYDLHAFLDEKRPYENDLSVASMFLNKDQRHIFKDILSASFDSVFTQLLESAGDVFPHLYQPVFNAVIELTQKIDSKKRFISFDFTGMAHHKRIAELIKAGLAYNYAALYLAALKWDELLKGDGVKGAYVKGIRFSPKVDLEYELKKNAGDL